MLYQHGQCQQVELSRCCQLQQAVVHGMQQWVCNCTVLTVQWVHPGQERTQDHDEPLYGWFASCIADNQSVYAAADGCLARSFDTAWPKATMAADETV